MVDRVRKALKRLAVKQQTELASLLQRIRVDDLAGCDVKKLQGRSDIYRVRKGSFRIIFRKVPQAENAIIAIERRSDVTYNEF